MRTFFLLASLVLAALPVQAGEIENPLTVTRLDLSEWVGNWKASEEQFITITMPSKRALEIDGMATYGMLDPERVASGGVNMGEFSVRIPARDVAVDNSIAFMVGEEGAEPPENASEYDCVIRMKLDWNINWIDVEDNRMCGGLNVSFTGRYEWYEPKGSAD